MRSTNMNVMFAYALARRLDRRRILVNAAHPWVIRTGLADQTSGLLRVMTKTASPFVARASVGSDTPGWLATSADIRSSGGFFKKRKRVSTAAHTTDPARLETFWRKSAEMAGLIR